MSDGGDVEMGPDLAKKMASWTGGESRGKDAPVDPKRRTGVEKAVNLSQGQDEGFVSPFRRIAEQVGDPDKATDEAFEDASREEKGKQELRMGVRPEDSGLVRSREERGGVFNESTQKNEGGVATTNRDYDRYLERQISDIEGQDLEEEGGQQPYNFGSINRGYVERGGKRQKQSGVNPDAKPIHKLSGVYDVSHDPSKSPQARIKQQALKAQRPTGTGDLPEDVRNRWRNSAVDKTTHEDPPKQTFMQKARSWPVVGGVVRFFWPKN